MNTSRRQNMHVNSLEVYFLGERQWFSKREIQVLEVVERMGKATDREIMLALGFSDMNSVRPRLTQLKEDGVIEEVGDKTCPVTKKTVRIVALKRDPLSAQALFSFSIEQTA